MECKTNHSKRNWVEREKNLQLNHEQFFSIIKQSTPSSEKIQNKRKKNNITKGRQITMLLVEDDVFFSINTFQIL